MLLKLGRHTTASTIYLIMFTNVAGDTLLYSNMFCFNGFCSWGIIYIYIICSHHDIAEILLKLALNTNQWIIPAPLSSETSDIIFKLLKAVSICLCLNCYFRCEACAKYKTNIESQVFTFIYISHITKSSPIQLKTYVDYL